MVTVSIGSIMIEKKMGVRFFSIFLGGFHIELFG